MGIFATTPVYKYAKNALKRLDGRQDEVFQLVLNNSEIKSLIKFLNTAKQLGVQHIDSEGEKLFNQFTDRTTYSLFDKKGRGGKEYTLRDTGDYWKSFEITIGRGFIEIKSDPIKGDDNLFDMFGQEIEGLTSENLQILIDEALELYIKWFRKNILP